MDKVISMFKTIPFNAIIIGFILLNGCKGTEMLPALDKLQSLDDISKAYTETESARDKLLIAIYAIEHEYIKREVSVDVVDLLFHTDFRNQLEGQVLEPGSSYWKVVDFEKPLIPSPSSQTHARRLSAVYTGWFLAIEFDSDMKVASYYISNLHK